MRNGVCQLARGRAHCTDSKESEKWSIPRCGTVFASSHVGVLTPQSNLTQDEIPELDKVVTLEITRISFLG